MAIRTINDDLILSAEAGDYFKRADRRIMIGLRAALELLDLPIPPYAQRQPTGPRGRSGRGIAARYALDNVPCGGASAPAPTTPMDLSARRLAAAVNKAKARIAKRQPA